MTLEREFEKEIEDKKVLVTGGTGSFGHHIVKELLNFNPTEVIIYSRDEDKQYRMRMEYLDERVRFVIGDVRDLERVLEATRGVDVIYHAAALKHVPYCEHHPYEAVKTNVIGAHNIRVAAIRSSVEKVIAISTDKAVKPINAMGISKALQEKIFTSSEEAEGGNTKFACVRYGNVIGSRGSVIPLFKEKMLKKESLPITNKEMTRFLITLEQAINLVFFATVKMKGKEIFVRKLPACKIIDLAEAMAKAITGRENYPIIEVGIRPGEKIHEVLVSEDELRRVEEHGTYYLIHPYGRLKRPKIINPVKEYTSNNTRILNKREIIELLKLTGWV